MRLKELNKDQWSECIKSCISTDPYLYEVTHHSPVKGIEGCTEFTLNVLLENEASFGSLSLYEIQDDSLLIEGCKRIGFIGYFKNYNILSTFMINKDSRTQHVFDFFFAENLKQLGAQYDAYLWKDNHRARLFFERHKGQLEFEDEEIVKYTFICQLQRG